ncbi:MAG: nodulation protein NfeD [Candidatus Zixiibacteriota bacterium]
MKTKFLIILLFLMCISPILAQEDVSNEDSAAITETGTEPSLVYILNIDGAIGAVTADRVIEAVELVEDEGADLLLITMDTPGGFNESMWSITKAIMNSSVPVAVYVSPSGAKAASAGVYITYAAHIAAMAPGSNIGAAHVVSMGGEMDSIMTEKVMNDAVASLKAMAERHGRNAEWAEEAARQSVSITSKDALDLHVIDFIADDVDDLLKKADGFEVNMVFGKKTVHTANPTKIPIKKTFIQSLLEIISSPNIVFILFSLGGMGLVLELYNPGAILPGVVGGICIILALYGMRTLPINYAGVLLILFSIILFVLEIKIVSHGLLTIGGVISIIIGGMMLVDNADPELRVSRSIIYTVAIVVGLFVILAFTLAYRARVAKPTTGVEGLVGTTGVVKTRIEKTGYVYLAGELWEASAEEIIEEGEEIVVVAVDNLKMKVRKKV